MLKLEFPKDIERITAEVVEEKIRTNNKMNLKCSQ